MAMTDCSAAVNATPFVITREVERLPAGEPIQSDANALTDPLRVLNQWRPSGRLGSDDERGDRRGGLTDRHSAMNDCSTKGGP